jgi:hypothetical protein
VNAGRLKSIAQKNVTPNTQAVGFSRRVGFFGGALFAATALPTSLSNLSWVYGIYNIVPHLAQVTCIPIMIVACLASPILARKKTVARQAPFHGRGPVD